MLIVRRDRHHVTRHQPEPRMQRPRTLGARALSTRIRQGRPSPKGHENGDEQWPASHLFSRTPGMCRSSACSVHKQPLTGASKRHRVAQVGLWRASATGNLHPFDGRLRASCSIHRGPEDEARMLKPIMGSGADGTGAMATSPTQSRIDGYLAGRIRSSGPARLCTSGRWPFP